MYIYIYVYVYIYILIYQHPLFHLFNRTVLRGIVGYQVKGTRVGAHHDGQKPSLLCWETELWISCRLTCWCGSCQVVFGRANSAPILEPIACSNSSNSSDLPICRPCSSSDWRLQILQGAPQHTGCKSPWALPCSPQSRQSRPFVQLVPFVWIELNRIESTDSQVDSVLISRDVSWDVCRDVTRLPLADEGNDVFVHKSSASLTPGLENRQNREA